MVLPILLPGRRPSRPRPPHWQTTLPLAPAGHDRHDAEQIRQDSAGPAPACGEPIQFGEFRTDT